MNINKLYGLYCPITDELKYIGITKNNLKQRLSEHLRKPTNYLTKKWFAELKKNELKPIIRLIESFDTYEELLQSEINEIKRCRELNIGILNLHDGGSLNPMLGKTHTEESRKKISLAQKGRKMTDEQKEKHRERIKELWSDKEWSEKLRKKISENNKGDKNPNWKGGRFDSICKCGNKKYFYSINCFNCRDITGEKNPFFGKTITPENKEKLSQYRKLNNNFIGEQNPNFKYKIEKDELFDLYIIQNKTIKELSVIYNCAINTINKNLRKYNINKPKSNIYNLDVIKIKNHLSNGLSQVEIGRIFNCSHKTIHRFIKSKKIYGGK